MEWNGINGMNGMESMEWNQWNGINGMEWNGISSQVETTPQTLHSRGGVRNGECCVCAHALLRLCAWPLALVRMATCAHGLLRLCESPLERMPCTCSQARTARTYNEKQICVAKQAYEEVSEIELRNLIPTMHAWVAWGGIGWHGEASGGMG